jgi:uncharacterized protein YndB with AHSA1/START domain
MALRAKLRALRAEPLPCGRSITAASLCHCVERRFNPLEHLITMATPPGSGRPGGAIRMTTTPTGRIVPTRDGRDLVLTRMFQAPIEDVWASITESERTARWFASWSGEAGPGRTIRYRLEFEEGRPEGDMTIDACDAPHHLAVSSHDEYGTWRLEATLAQDGDTTVLTFVQHLDPEAKPGEIGPGWEYYLDLLVAAREGGPAPDFGDYYPAQSAHYEALAPEA